MRLALLNLRRRLLMQLDHPRTPSPLPNPPLKRPLSHATATSYKPSTQTASDSESQRPGKIPKLAGKYSPSSRAYSPSSAMPPPSSQSRRGPGPSLLSRIPSGHGQMSSGGRNRKGKKGSGSAVPTQTLPDPMYDEAYIAQIYRKKNLKSVWEENPKSPLANFMNQRLKKQPAYESIQGIAGNGKTVWRTTVRVQGDDLNLTGYGDNANRRESERLAALAALYQIDGVGALDSSARKAKKSESGDDFSPLNITLSDGSPVDYERGRQFMDYYCRRFGFAKAEISYTSLNARSGNTAWQADMVVNDRKIGFGKAPNKKNAMMSCYVDVTQYLEQCDPAVWKEFLKDAKTGRDLGMAPRVRFAIDDTTQDRVEDLCTDIKKSVLYQNRPRSQGYQANGEQRAGVPTAPRAPYRRPVAPAYLETKSQQLKQRRETYLNDPNMAKMRELRALLPVYTKADELLSHVREHDVTICMAATGSGKTTQIPQLILDDAIERGEGAKCNIVCTQPRRIAAISVADRVAKERGESAGRNSSVGYQVRFESNLPEDHGSVTFCTTGIFLKRMQSALQGESMGRSLDDVTHIVVDEVHERDVDTDLLLVVLKRLIADRKARGRPVKVVLMSATINPTLFQEYFPDEKGRPASVIDIPGRAFPVQKRFLEDFVHRLADTPAASWVFQEEPVKKYLRHQLGSAAPVPQLRNNSMRGQQDEPATMVSTKDEEVDLPISLIALTIAHVLNSSEDGHVLVFLPGWDDIIAVQKCLAMDPRRLLGINFNDQRKYSIHLLHSSIPVKEQQIIFDPPPEGVRRIILATNVAETSVTIPDVVYVVDTARVKEQRYDPERHISALVSAWVGLSNLNQRAGRAGRHRPGEYYGILGQQFADSLHPYQTVEMKRVDLSNVVMHVKALNFPGMTVEEVLAEAIEPPAPDRVEAAIRSLQMVGALDHQHNLTSLGRVLLQLPVDVQMGRLVLFGSFFRCLDQALTLAAILTNRDPFVAPMHLKVEAAAKKNSFTPEDFRSDALAILNAYNAWWDLQKQGMYVSANRFCVENFLAKPTLLTIQKIKEHLLQSLYQAGVIEVSAGGGVTTPTGPMRGEGFTVPPELNTNSDSKPLLAALIAIAAQPKFAIRTGEKSYRTATDKMVFIHPSSVNHRKRELAESVYDSNPVVEDRLIISYAEKRQNVSGGSTNAQKNLVTTSRLDPLTYILFGAYEIEVTARGLECDGWLPIVGNGSNHDALDELERLKTQMDACMLRVFEGIIAGKAKLSRGRRVPARVDAREDESADDDDGPEDRSLSQTEIKELDLMTRDIVRILNGYSTYRVAMQSQHNSRPATPMDSPSYPYGRLPSLGGTRSGYSTPFHGYSSRPSTPSRLSGRYP